jgi:hypothetical protein
MAPLADAIICSTISENAAKTQGELVINISTKGAAVEVPAVVAAREKNR